MTHSSVQNYGHIQQEANTTPDVLWDSVCMKFKADKTTYGLEFRTVFRGLGWAHSSFWGADNAMALLKADYTVGSH